MINLFPLVFLLFYFFYQTPLPKISKKENSDTINWNPNRKLAWEDFQGPSKADSYFSAETHYAITYSYRKSSQLKNPELKFKVQCFFEKDRSWCKHKDANDQLLAHEQAHFDIAELHARFFRERISKTRFDEINYESQIQKMFADILDECKKMQEQFDSETKFGTLAAEQNNWILNVEDALNYYSPYSKISIQSLNPYASNN